MLDAIKRKIKFQEATYNKHNTIVYIVERFPSQTEQFVRNEILEMERMGFVIQLLVLRRNPPNRTLPPKKNVKANVNYLPRLIYYFPILALISCPIIPIIAALFKARSATSNKLSNLRYYCYAAYFAQRLGKNSTVKHIHAHFAFITTDVAYYLSRILGISHSFTAHAQDIYVNAGLKKKVELATFVITCTRYNQQYLNTLTLQKHQEKVFQIYHGIDLNFWLNSYKEQRFETECLHIISVARLVEKKGLIYLLEAIEALKKLGIRVFCWIIGEGPKHKEFKHFIEIHQLQENIAILPFMTQENLKIYYQKSDILVLPCIIGENGDRDGLPNVIVEALAIGLPTITTAVSAITELIKEEETGLIVPEKNSDAIVRAVLKLQKDCNLQKRIIRSGHQAVINQFDMHATSSKLEKLFSSV